jgi:hypothetical protein
MVWMGLAGVATGCKVSRWQKSGDTGTPAAAALPQRAGDEAASAAPVTFDVDDKTGRPKSNVVLRLDYFPDPQPGQANLPACYDEFPADFDLGTVSCVDKPAVSQPLLAKNVEQDCYTDPKRERVAAGQPLLLPGCRKGQIVTHAFTPALRVDLEVRDVN